MPIRRTVTFVNISAFKLGKIGKAKYRQTTRQGKAKYPVSEPFCPTNFVLKSSTHGQQLLRTRRHDGHKTSGRVVPLLALYVGTRPCLGAPQKLSNIHRSVLTSVRVVSSRLVPSPIQSHPVSYPLSRLIFLISSRLLSCLI